MKPITDAEIEAFHSARQKYLRLEFSDGTIVENADIANESMSFTQTICDDSQLTFGRCSSACFKIKLLGVAQRYAGLTVTVKISAFDSNNVEHRRNIGTFRVVSDKATSDKLYRELECYDVLYDILSTDYSEWYNALTFPMTLKNYRDAFFRHIGVTQESVNLINDSMTVTKNFVAENYSGSDLIEDICEINGVFGIVNSDNKFQYISIEELPKGLYPRDDLYPSDDLYPVGDGDYRSHFITKNEYYMGTLTYEEYTCQPITQLQIRMSENDIGAIVGTQGNTYIIQDNPLVYGKEPSELTSIANTVLGKITGITYIPMSIEIPACLWYELGDAFRIQANNDVVHTIMLSVNLTGITALKQKFESRGQETYAEKANSVERSILVVKQKTNELERNVEETKSTITEVRQELEGDVETLQSQITQNAESITAEVSRASTAEGSLSTRINQTDSAITAEVTRATNAEKTIVVDYTNDYVPTLSNSPASSWTTDNLRAQHIGEIFYNSDNGHYYEWQCEGLSVNFDALCSTENTHDYVYVYYNDGSQYQQSAKLTGGYNGTTNTIAGAKIFVPSSTVYVQWHTDSSVNDWGFKIDSITKTVGKTDNQSSVSSLTVTDIISGVTNLPESDHPYTESVSKVYQINTGITVAGYRWVDVGVKQSNAIRSIVKQTADEITQTIEDMENGLTSSIRQNAKEISLKVSEGEVSSQLSVESGQVKIESNRLVVNSDNFKLTSTGIITANGANIEGELKTGTSNYYLYLNGDTIQGKYGSSNTGKISLTGSFSNIYGNTIFMESAHIAFKGSTHVYVGGEFGYDYQEGIDGEFVGDINYTRRDWCDIESSHGDVTTYTFCLPTEINRDGTVEHWLEGVTINRWYGNSAYSHNWGYVRKGIVIGYPDDEVIEG